MRPFGILLLILTLVACQARAGEYDIDYEITVHPADGIAAVSIELSGEELPSKVEVHLSGDRYRDLESNRPLEIDDDVATWRPQESGAILSYRYVIDHKRDGDTYDSRITEDWAVMRSDELIPPMAVTAKKSLRSSAVIDFDLPDGWSSATPYKSIDDSGHRYRLVDPGRKFIRPKGWLVLGAIASRQDVIDGVNVRVASPRGQDIRLQDTLAFINWTLPYLNDIFPDFPPRLLVVSAGDPMWRGGLSAPNSLFMHGDRPLISGNRTSSLIHELVHIGTSIHGTDKSDWIVESIAEYYAVEILRRSGGISERRFRQTLDELAAWGAEADGLFTGRASGATTARGVDVMYAVDQEIRDKTGDEASLDEVGTALAKNGGTITVQKFVDIAEDIAGGELDSLADIKARLED